MGCCMLLAIYWGRDGFYVFICLCGCICVCECVCSLDLNQTSGFHTRSKWSSAFNYTVYCLHRFSLRYELTHTHTYTAFTVCVCVCVSLSLSLNNLCVHTCLSERSVRVEVLYILFSKSTHVALMLQIQYNGYTRRAVRHSLHTSTHRDTVVVSGSPSTARLSTPPWLYTGTPSAWRRQSCQSWWCRRLGPPIPLCTLFH